jgi:REP element-mobilizing transposase RayT
MRSADVTRMFARPVIAGRTYLLTRRVTQRQFLLRPEAEVNQIYLYALAVAAKRYGIAIHGWVAMSNHHHVVFTDLKGNYPKFLAYMHRLIAICVNDVRGRRENLWSVEQANVVWLVAKTDRLAKLVYALANPVAAGLVERITDWPGAISFAESLHGKNITIERPQAVFATKGPMPEKVDLQVERLPGYERLTREQWKEHLLEALVEAEKSALQILRQEKRRVLGRKAVLATDPFSSPRTKPTNDGPPPWIACADKARLKVEEEILDAFHVLYDIARVAWKERREYKTRFPFGTYKFVELGARASRSPLTPA